MVSFVPFTWLRLWGTPRLVQKKLRKKDEGLCLHPTSFVEKPRNFRFIECTCLWVYGSNTSQVYLDWGPSRFQTEACWQQTKILFVPTSKQQWFGCIPHPLPINKLFIILVRVIECPFFVIWHHRTGVKIWEVNSEKCIYSTCNLIGFSPGDLWTHGKPNDRWPHKHEDHQRRCWSIVVTSLGSLWCLAFTSHSLWVVSRVWSQKGSGLTKVRVEKGHAVPEISWNIIIQIVVVPRCCTYLLGPT